MTAKRVAAALGLALLLNSFYLLAFASPTIFYMANVLAHLALGAAAAGAFAWLLWRSVELRQRAKLAAAVLFAGAALGGALAWTGALLEFRWLLWAHVLVSFAGVALLIPAVRWPGLKWAFGAGAAFAVVAMSVGAMWPDPSERIRNPEEAPESMEEEGGGPQSPFWPSAARTNVKGTVPAEFFMDSQLCGECHKTIYEQWRSSMHHLSSFNNQFYRKSIEHMQDISGTQSSKWCAGCHDHAMLFSGKWEQPVREQLETAEAHTGLGCVSCHSIVHVDSSMGNGGFTLEYPKLHELAASRNPYMRALDRLLTHLDPEPHRRTFIKPFMREDSAEFCAACHKVHLDQPVNHYRWLRGFNDYDNWQASGVSGQGARSFYYPAKPQTCADCHMPLVPSRDPGHRNGMVHSHRFATANTAVPFVNGDETQLKAAEGFLKSGFITVDIFAASPAEEGGGLQMVRRAGDRPQEAMTTFAVGEEADTAAPVFLREVGKVAAPLDQAGTRFRPGDTVRVDVVVRTRKIGHFFPGGTVDAFDVWLELVGRDAKGRTVFWSGRVEDEGRGPVDPGAHFYRSLMLDGDGNPIDKRNAWQARSLLYVRLIPPGAADVVRYRMKIPQDAEGPITLTAKLHHRKFSWQYTRFAYAGHAAPGQDPRLVSLHYDSREYDYSPENIPANVAGGVKGRIPALPIVTLAQAETKLELGPRGAEPEWLPLVRTLDRERWNDWGIGLLLQGDLKGAEYAFRKVTEADPDYPDGWVNIARALIQEGETEEARPLLERALKLSPGLARAQYFLALVEKAAGEYEASIALLRQVTGQYPRDRVVQNQLGRLLFLQRDYAQSARAFRAVLAVDPEDVQAHYSLMLAYRGLGDMERMRKHERLFRRFKADESAQAITAKRRMVSPEDNNERQAIHEHESIPLP
ncbi:MAG: tetratricopeptide repeat protein [Bryobacteraceae bacterium]|nr:tetratricopeptide repeat protein [Bryobacteraceae bacterium]